MIKRLLRRWRLRNTETWLKFYQARDYEYKGGILRKGVHWRRVR